MSLNSADDDRGQIGIVKIGSLTRIPVVNSR